MSAAPAREDRQRLYASRVFPARHVPLRVSRHVIDGDLPTHDHDFFEIALVADGRGIHRTILGDQPIAEGDVIVLRPGAWHGYLRCQGLEIYNCCLRSELLHGEVGWLLEEPTFAALLGSDTPAAQTSEVVTLRLPPDVMGAYRQQLARLGELLSGDRLVGKAALLGHLLLLLDSLRDGMGAVRRGAQERAAPIHPAVVTAIRLLRAEPGRHWTLAALGAMVALSPAYLVRAFKRSTGLSPMAYLARHRTATAAILLVRTGQPVARIGEAVGWPDPNYFARRFKAYFGVNATTYRATYAAINQDERHIALDDSPSPGERRSREW